MEDISSACCVNDRDAKSGYVVELNAVPGQNAILTERGGGKSMTKAALHGLKRLSQRGGSCEALGKIAADDSVIGEGKQIVEIGVNLVEVGDDRDTCRARPLRGLNGRGSVVAIQMQKTSAGNPFAAQLTGMKVLARIAMPQHGALTVLVQQDNALPAVAIRHGGAMGFDAKASKFRPMKSGSGVIAKFANVARGQRPRGARGNGRRYLSSGKSGKAGKLKFGSGDRKMRKRNHGIDGIKAEADNIDGRRQRQFIWAGLQQGDSVPGARRQRGIASEAVHDCAASNRVSLRLSRHRGDSGVIP